MTDFDDAVNAIYDLTKEGKIRWAILSDGTNWNTTYGGRRIWVQPDGSMTMKFEYEGLSRYRRGDGEAVKRLAELLSTQHPIPKPVSDDEYFGKFVAGLK